MRINRDHSRRRVMKFLATAAAVALGWLAMAGTASAADVVKVEEDWELVLSAPSYEKGSPQFETSMSPFGNSSNAFARVTWNYIEEPDFVPGGFQTQAWNGSRFEREEQVAQQSFWVAGETVTWTQHLRVWDNTAYFKVKNGNSATWGNFGGDETRVRLTGTVANLNSYSPDHSVAKSGITFGSNRVAMLRIKEVRKYAADGSLVAQDTTSRVVFDGQND